jgi:hypothetical protein
MNEKKYYVFSAMALTSSCLATVYMLSDGYLTILRGNIHGSVAAGLDGLAYIAFASLILLIFIIIAGRKNLIIMVKYIVGYIIGIPIAFILSFIIYQILWVLLKWAAITDVIISFSGAVLAGILTFQAYKFLKTNNQITNKSSGPSSGSNEPPPGR